MTTRFPPSLTPRSRWAAILFLLVILVVGALLWLRASHHGAGAPAPDVLKVGDQRGGAQALLRASGELDHVPYKIEFALFPAASPLLEALGANAIDIGGIGGAPFAFAYASGQPIKAVYAYRPDPAKAGQSSAIIVRRDSPIRSLADLKGKRLSTIRGSAGQDTALRLIEHAGLKARDVQWVYLDNAQAKAALSSGAIDAWSTWGSYVGIAAIENGDRILADARNLPSSVGFYAASDAAIASKRALIADFIARLERARQWGRAHPRDYAAALAKETGISFDVALFSIQGYTGATAEIDKALIDEQRAIFERYRDAGIIPSVPNLDGGYDASFTASAGGARH